MRDGMGSEQNIPVGVASKVKAMLWGRAGQGQSHLVASFARFTHSNK